MSSLRDGLPSAVEVAEGPDVAPGPLTPAERRAVERAVASRQAEFAVGRTLARRALAGLGVVDATVTSIEVGARREPRWPVGVVGSITHCAGWAGAAVAWSADVAALGVDVEVHARLDDAVAAQVCRSEELAALPDGADVHWATVLFSAREAIYKAWYPVVGAWLGFHDVRLDLDPTTGDFTIEYLGEFSARAAAHRLDGLRGTTRWTDDHVYAAAWLLG